MIRRLVAPVIAAFGLLVALAVPAAAHVKVSSDNATKGGYATIAIRVPNEESDADTVGLKLQLPVDHPIANVSVQPKPGWTFKTKTSKLAKPVKTQDGTIDEAVTEIDWSGGKIAPGEFDQFFIQAGPMPTDTDSVTFKAIQTYRDSAGKTSQVAWIQETQPGQPEPPHPAPVLKLTSADASAGAAPATTGSDVAASAGTNQPTVAATTSTSSGDSSGLATAALIVGIVGLVAAIAALALVLTRRRATASGPNLD